MLLTLEAETELCGDPSREALTVGPGARSLPVRGKTRHKMKKMRLMTNAVSITINQRSQGCHKCYRLFSLHLVILRFICNSVVSGVRATSATSQIFQKSSHSKHTYFKL